MNQKIFYSQFTTLLLTITLNSLPAHALPAFAFREKVSCTLCHSNGAAPHLTKAGFLFRRAGFRFPADIGNEEKDAAGLLDLRQHVVAGLNIDYNVTDIAPPGRTESLINNGVSVREAEIWPAVGAFFGHFAAWSELDMQPTSNAIDPNGNGTATTQSTGGVSFEQADLRYVHGNADAFYTFRAGKIAGEGFGASDQWLDDGNIPLFDQMAMTNQKTTYVTPLGAMQSPQMGLELGYSQGDNFLTFSMLNGLDATTGSAITMSSNGQKKSARDYKLQYDRFLGEKGALTATYYNGNVLVDENLGTGGAPLFWTNNYSLGRLYYTYFLNPNVFDILAGVSYSDFEFVNPGTTDLAGHFFGRGSFVGFLWYANPHLSVGAHADYIEHAYNTATAPKSKGLALMVSLPYEYNIFVFHLNVLASDVGTDPAIVGTTNDFRAEWRFIY